MSVAFPVLLGIDLDAEAIWTGRSAENASRPILLSHGTFAVREGLDPLLKLLAEHGVKASFFIPGTIVDRYPEAVQRIAAAGHDLGSHGYEHKPIPGLTAEEERAELHGGIEALERLTGVRPKAWRAPAWEWSARTLELLIEAGVTISANYHDALRPYRHKLNGEPTQVLELPVQWHLADAPYFSSGGSARVIRSAAEVETIWREDFDALYQMPGTMFHLTLHVQLIGHPGRLAMLDRLIRYMKGHPRVAFARVSEMSEAGLLRDAGSEEAR